MLNETLEEYQHLENYADYIEEMKEEFTNQIENCLNSYNIINETVQEIGRVYPDFNTKVFGKFFDILEVFFSLFSNTNDILSNFSLLNEQVQKSEQVIFNKIEELNNLRIQNQELTEENNNKDYCIKKYEEEVDTIKKDFASLRNTITDTPTPTDSKKISETEHNSVLKKVEELKESNLNLENKINELNSTITYLESVNSNLEKDYNKKQQNLNLEASKNEENYILKINKLQNDLEKSEKDNKKILNELEDKKKEIIELREEALKNELLKETFINNKNNNTNIDNNDNKLLANIISETCSKIDVELKDEDEDEEFSFNRMNSVCSQITNPNMINLNNMNNINKDMSMVSINNKVNISTIDAPLKVNPIFENNNSSSDRELRRNIDSNSTRKPPQYPINQTKNKNTNF